MDNDPTNLLGKTLARDINGLLEYDGMTINDREIIISPENIRELDVTDIVIDRDDEYQRTVCHVHRPPTAVHYWRHDTYVAWDDGRTAWFNIDIALDEPELQIMDNLRTCHHDLLGEFEVLIARNVIDKSQAEELYDGILTELEHITRDINEELLRADALHDGPSLAILRQAIRQMEAEAPIREAPVSAYEKVYEAAHRLRAAHYDAIELRANLVERYVEQSRRHLNTAESDPTVSAPPSAIWNLLDLLDKLRNERST